MARFDPTRPDFAPYGLTCVRWTPEPMRRPDRHNEVEINLVEEGTLTYLLGARKVTIPTGRLALFWAAIPHQIIEATGRRDYFVMTLPLAWFLQCGLSERLVQPILHAQVVCDPAPTDVRRDADRFGQWVADLRSTRQDRREVVLLEIQARLKRLAMAMSSDRSRTADRARRGGAGVPVEEAGLSKAEQMACFIAQHYVQPLSVEEIAASVTLHPNYAMNLFRRVFRTTINAYLTQHRISHAQRLLVTSDQKILAIALDSGFGSISRFNDAFRRECGCSPRTYRSEHRL